MANRLHLETGTEPYPGIRLLHVLGKGGWGEVWKAERADGSNLALKFLPCDNQFHAAQEMRGLQTIRLLRHPNLTQIDSVWSCPGYLVVVMELAEGSLLDLFEIYQAEFRSGILPEHLCYYLYQAAQAIDFLNTRQHKVNGQRFALRHCDIKPSNLLVFGRTIKLTDFSLAVQTTSRMEHHRRAGTPLYAAPEVHQGWLSEQSDQYSLAVTYCLLRTGDVPFSDVPQAFTAPHAEAVPKLDRLSSDERPILARALAAVPQDRWPSCVDMMKRLGQCHIKANLAGVRVLVSIPEVLCNWRR